jgi:hypothetical protein
LSVGHSRLELISESHNAVLGTKEKQVKTKTEVKWTTIRDNENTITEYHGNLNGYTLRIHRIDAIGLGVVYTFNTFVFDKLSSAKTFAQAGA